MHAAVGQPVWAYSRAVRADIPGVVASIDESESYRQYVVATADERIDGTTTVLEDDLTPVMCEWFALCTNFATHFQVHLILGDVPICDRCQGRYDRA